PAVDGHLGADPRGPARGLVAVVEDVEAHVVGDDAGKAALEGLDRGPLGLAKRRALPLHARVGPLLLLRHRRQAIAAGRNASSSCAARRAASTARRSPRPRSRPWPAWPAWPASPACRGWPRRASTSRVSRAATPCRRRR